MKDAEIGDGRRKRTSKTREAILSAMARLRDGRGTHPAHVGKDMLITRAAIAREARVSQATLYRYGDLIRDLAPAERCRQRAKGGTVRSRLMQEIAERDRRIGALLAENLRLMRELEQYDVTLGRKAAVDLSAERTRRRGAGGGA